MADSIVNEKTFSNLIFNQSISEISEEDKIILIVAKEYMAITRATTSGFCHELFELSSQYLYHAAQDLEAYLDKQA